MAFEYFLYTTEFNNTLVDRSKNSFAPLPPNTGQVFLDFFIPTNQPLYLYKESSANIVLNDQQTIDDYLNATTPPLPDDEVTIGYLTTNYVHASGGTFYGPLSFDDTPTGDTKYGQILEGEHGSMKLAGDVGINLSSPYLILPNASGFTGSFLTVGQDGLITFTRLNSGGTAPSFWQNTNAGPVTSLQNIEKDLNVPVQNTVDFSSGNAEWFVNVDNNTNQSANIELRFYRNNILTFTETYSIPRQEIAELYGSVPIFNLQPSGTTYDLKIFSSKNVVCDNILLRINNSEASTLGAEWGSIIGNINDQLDLQLQFTTKLDKSIFNVYTGDTETTLNGLENNKVDRSGDTITNDLKIEGSLYVTGTSATTNQLDTAVLLGALTTDGKIVATNTPALNVSEEVTDVSGNTIITQLSGIYYVDTTVGNITIQVPDASPSNDVSRLTILKKTNDTNLVFVTTTGGTQNIGDATTQTIGQVDKGISIVSDSDNNKWIIVQDSRFPQGQDEGTLLAWNDTDKVWQSTTNDVTWDRTNLKFVVGGNSNPETFQVDATDDIVYINASGLTGLTSLDNLGFYAGGRGAFGNRVTIDRLRNNVPGLVPRALSLIDTHAVMRVWRYVNDGNDPAVEFVWGIGDAPSDTNNNWWDMFLDGGTGGTDTFAIRRRTGGIGDKLLTISTTGVYTPLISSVGEKFNMAIGYNNTNLTDGDLWADNSLYFRSGGTSYNLIPSKGPLKSVGVRQSTQVNNIPTAWTDFNWDSTDIENDITVIEHDNINIDRIYVYEDGLYFMSYQFQIDDEAEARVRINDTIIINGSHAISDATALSLPVMKTFLVDLLAGDFVTMQTLGLANGQDVDAGANMIITKFDGLKGDKGNDGVGSTIILQENNTNVANTPHGTLNFDNNFTVTDNGGGKATVSIGVGSGAAGLCELIDTVGGTEMNNVTPVAMTWDTNEFLDSTTYTHTLGTSTITVLKTGLYEISYNINAANQTNNRSTSGVQVRKNGILIGKSLTADYTRNTSNNDNNNTLPPTSVSMTANDTFDVVVFRLGDNNSTLTKAGASFVRIKYMGT